MTLKQALLAVSLILPLAGLGGVLAQADHAHKTRETYTLKISAYDPRDILRGQYLQFKYDWPAGTPETIAFEKDRETVLCLENAPEGVRTHVSTDRANDVACENFVTVYGKPMVYTPSAKFERTGRYYLPEDKAAQVNRLLQDKANVFTVTVFARDGELVPTQLFINGKRWDEALDADASLGKNRP